MHYVDAGGARIPALGLGTWDLRGDVCAEMVEQALRLGYRHIDTVPAWIVKAVSGSTVHWAGASLRFQEHDFEIAASSPGGPRFT
jgi:diketogulonate reductase-like aldo/keto reductase